MLRETLADGTTIYRYLEESRDGRVVVTLMETDEGLYFSHRGWYSDKEAANADLKDGLTKDICIAWIDKEGARNTETPMDAALEAMTTK